MQRSNDMNARRTVYLANPYGFSESLKTGPLRDLCRRLEALGAEVWEPFESIENRDRSVPQWAWRIARSDARGVRDADGVFAVVNGCPPDEGVMVEVGLAIAWQKPLFLFRDDFRRCSDSEDYPLNLMLFAGYTADGWRDYWYDSIESLACPEKALVGWLRGEDVRPLEV